MPTLCLTTCLRYGATEMLLEAKTRGQRPERVEGCQWKASNASICFCHVIFLKCELLLIPLIKAFLLWPSYNYGGRTHKSNTVILDITGKLDLLRWVGPRQPYRKTVSSGSPVWSSTMTHRHSTAVT